VIFIEQKCGPHMEQKCASLAPSCGSVSSWELLRRVGIIPRLNWSAQRNRTGACDKRVVARLRAGMPLGEVGCVRRDLVGDDAVFHVLLVRQPEMLLGRDLAQHRGTVPADHRCADRAGDVVVPRRDVVVSGPSV
jgi:hypothetical protein